MATVFAIMAKWIRQPVILGYIAAGILVGETEGLKLISTAELEPVSELGLILLLFMIGLEIDLKKLARAGKFISAAGLGQFLICVSLGLFLFPADGLTFGDGRLVPFYLAVALALSSTMIVVKLLHDKSELDTTAGRVTLGILVFQDIWAILFLAIQPNLGDPSALVLVTSLVKGAGVVAFAFAVSRFVLPVLFRSIATVPELTVLGALAWCFGVVLLCTSLGLSSAMGALIAGISLSTFPYNLEVLAKVISLRDFFITLFFVTLGTKISLPTADTFALAVAASAFVIISRFLSITPLLKLAGADNRLSIIPALNLAQVSEFSLVICALGVSLGHIGGETLSVVVLAMVITSVSGSYGILYSHQIFLAVNPLLERVGMRNPSSHGGTGPFRPANPIVLLGFFRQASSVLDELLHSDPELAQRITVIDYNPEVKERLDQLGVLCIYGDISNSDTLHHAGVAAARLIVSTVPDSVLKGTSNQRLLRQARAIAPNAKVIVTADVIQEARELYAAGADYVLIPRLLCAADLLPLLSEALPAGIAAHRADSLAALEHRAEILP